MAVNIVQKKPKVTGSSGSAGGSKYGQIAGALAAGGLIAATGGGAAPVLAAAGTGATLGGLAGGIIDPAKADTRQAIQRRVEGMGQQTAQIDPVAQLQKSINALKATQNPELIQQYAPPLAQALVKAYNPNQEAIG